MQQFVRDWMSNPVVVIPQEVFVDQAVALMRRRGIHSLVVDLPMDNGNKFGILTTSDIRDKIAALGCYPSEVRVSDIMTSPIQCAGTGWTLREAAQAMQELNIHHLPVQNRRETLVGMISITDVFFAVEEAGWTGIS